MKNMVKCFKPFIKPIKAMMKKGKENSKKITDIAKAEQEAKHRKAKEEVDMDSKKERDGPIHMKNEDEEVDFDETEGKPITVKA